MRGRTDESNNVVIEALRMRVQELDFENTRLKAALGKLYEKV